METGGRVLRRPPQLGLGTRDHRRSIPAAPAITSTRVSAHDFAGAPSSVTATRGRAASHRGQCRRLLHSGEHGRGRRLPRFDGAEVVRACERLVRLPERMRVVGHLFAERGFHEVVPPELYERERLDRPVLHGRRTELAGEIDPEIACLHAALELRARSTAT